MKKRGLSSIIATVLIILLVIIAIGIVWAVLKPSIKKSAESANLDCLKVDLEAEATNCAQGQVKVTSKLGDISKLRFVFENATDSSHVDRAVAIVQASSKVVSFNSNETVANFTTVKVAAILTASDGTEKICETPATASC